MPHLARSIRRLAALAALAVLATACIPPPPPPDLGYRLITNRVYIPGGQVVIQLVNSPNVERLRAPAIAAAAEIQATTGMSVVVIPWNNPDPTQVDGILKIRVEDGACAPSAVACMRYRFFGTSQGVYLGDQEIAFEPEWAASLTDAQIRATVYHEIGHAVGLDHYVGSYQGGFQMMYPGLIEPPPTRYGAGDLNGFRAVTYLTTDPGGSPIPGWIVTG